MHDPFPQSHAMGGALAYGMVGMLQGAANVGADIQDSRAIKAWDNELRKARGDAKASEVLALALIARIAELEADNARLERRVEKAERVIRRRS